MNVWIRIVGVLDVEDTYSRESPTKATIQSGLDLTIYRTKEQATAAQIKAGGIVLEVDARCLGEVNNEFGKDVYLLPYKDTEVAETKSTRAAICVACISKLVPNYGPNAPGTVEPQGEIMEFSSDEEVWLDELTEQTGFDLHQ